MRVSIAVFHCPERPGATKSSAKMGMLGVEQTLEALANGQVEELLISSDIDSIEYSKKKIIR